MTKYKNIEKYMGELVEKGVEYRFIFNDKYIISSNGELFSIYYKNKVITKIRETPLKLKPALSQGYHRYSCYDGKVNYIKIHSMVLETFKCKRPKGMYACHINGNKTDNRLSNLYWGTPSDNQQDKFKPVEQYLKNKGG